MDVNTKQVKMKAVLLFVAGPIKPDQIAGSISSFSELKQVGAHSIFMGQVRNDLIDGRKVRAIEYTAYEEMARDKADEIVIKTSKNFALEDVKIYHSLGEVKSGEICLFVIAVSKHRKGAIEGCQEIVEQIKHELPIWGKEKFEDESTQWKVNR
jgi:molybdopterin synthase catalytic subunit